MKLSLQREPPVSYTYLTSHEDEHPNNNSINVFGPEKKNPPQDRGYATLERSGHADRAPDLLTYLLGVLSICSITVRFEIVELVGRDGRDG